MADIFFTSDAKKLLSGKHLVFFGDSNTRAIYKDIVCLLSRNKLIDQSDLRRKQEPSYSGDKLGKHTPLKQGRDYEEERHFQSADGSTKVDFVFITKCYTSVLVDMMEDIHLGITKAPDIIYINSTFWDVCRWGPNGATLFKENVKKLAQLFKSSLPSTTLVIWATALPVSHNVQSSLLIKQIDFLRHSLRFDVMEANQFAREVMVSKGFDVLDNHFHMRMQIHRRVKDGVHYTPQAIRLLTNLLLTHVALSWDFPLPNRVQTLLLEKAKAMCGPNKSTPEPELPEVPNCLQAKPSSPARANQRRRSRVASSKKNNYRGKNTHSRREIPPRETRSAGSRNNNWNSAGSKNERGWSRTNNSPPPARQAPTNVPVWEVPLGNNCPPTVRNDWANDYWPEGSSTNFLGNDQSYNYAANNQMYPTNHRFLSSYYNAPRVYNNYQSNELLNQALRQRQILDNLKRNNRYTPY